MESIINNDIKHRIPPDGLDVHLGGKVSTVTMKVVDSRVGKDGNIRTRDSGEYVQAIDLSIREILYPCIDGFTFEYPYLQEGNGKVP